MSRFPIYIFTLDLYDHIEDVFRSEGFEVSLETGDEPEYANMSEDGKRLIRAGKNKTLLIEKDHMNTITLFCTDLVDNRHNGAEAFFLFDNLHEYQEIRQILEQILFAHGATIR